MYVYVSAILKPLLEEKEYILYTPNTTWLERKIITILPCTKKFIYILKKLYKIVEDTYDVEQRVYRNRLVFSSTTLPCCCFVVSLDFYTEKAIFITNSKSTSTSMILFYPFCFTIYDVFTFGLVTFVIFSCWVVALV